MTENTEITGIVNKVNPFSLLLFYMRDKSICGIYKLGHGHVAYFRLSPDAAANRSRHELLKLIHVEGSHPHPESLSFDQFVAGLSGGRVRKIWLAKSRGKPVDLVFLSMKELEHYMHLHPAQHEKLHAPALH